MSNPLVSIVMGSDSDLPVMQGAAGILKRLEIPFDTAIVSAHRTPEETRAFAEGASARGIKVIIAGAGGAAHLPGVIAAATDLPVIGVPIKTAALGGTDSLYSMVQMPSGVPVAVVGIDAAKNAGILAARIVALDSAAVRKRLETFREEMAREVNEKNVRLLEVGIDRYLNELDR